MSDLEIFDIVLAIERNRPTEIVSKSLSENWLLVTVVFSADVVITWNHDATLLACFVIEDRVEAVEVAFEFIVAGRKTLVEDIAQEQSPVGLDVRIHLREGLRQIPKNDGLTKGHRACWSLPVSVVSCDESQGTFVFLTDQLRISNEK